MLVYRHLSSSKLIRFFRFSTVAIHRIAAAPALRSIEFTPSNPISPSNHPAHQLAAQSTPSVRFRHILPFIQDKNFFNQILNIYQATPFNPSGHDTPCIDCLGIQRLLKGPCART
ncbi:hypothetical protein H4Q26_003953 [Puccinia striiformis f. sp. tritici PST-130]|nr:hypothetical protein H4Q26_003953 [Puccinia striiformis f. sp. tritici PST-130]